MRRRTIIAVAVAGVITGGMTYGADNAPVGETAQFLEMLQYGWPINLTLGILGFVALFITFHVYLTTRRVLTVPVNFLREVLDDIASQDVEQAQQRAANNPSLLAQAILPGLKVYNHPLERIRHSVEGGGRRAIGSIRQEITYLANIGVLCPMIGLLGTVLGLMNAFVVMGLEQNAGSKAMLMSAAISKAITTTAVGLMVGIPCMAMYYILISRIGRISDEVEISAEDVVESLGEIK